MPRYTVTNNSSNLVPLPVSPAIKLVGRGSKVITLPAHEMDTPAMNALIKSGLVSVSSVDDPDTSNAIEVPTTQTAQVDTAAVAATIPAGATPELDFAVDIYTGTLSGATSPTLANPVLGDGILLKLTGGSLTLPGTVTVYGGGVYDGGVNNIITITCIDADTPEYIATISQE